MHSQTHTDLFTFKLTTYVVPEPFFITCSYTLAYSNLINFPLLYRTNTTHVTVYTHAQYMSDMPAIEYTYCSYLY